MNGFVSVLGFGCAKNNEVNAIQKKIANNCTTYKPIDIVLNADKIVSYPIVFLDLLDF